MAGRKDALEEDLRQLRVNAEKAARAANLWKNVVPTMEHVLRAYDLEASAEERNGLLKQAIEKIVYQKDTAGEAPTLFFYPKIKK